MTVTVESALAEQERRVAARDIRLDLHAAGLGGLSPLQRVSVRDDTSVVPDNSWDFYGHAAVFNHVTTLFEFTDDLGTVTVNEQVAPGAFDQALAQPSLLVHLNNGHDMKQAMARTGVNGRGGLRIAQDDFGLPWEARVNPEVGYVRDTGLQLKDGVIDQGSFKFTVDPHGETVVESGDPNGDWVIEYTITDVNYLFDVCICAQGAYSTATSGIRSRYFAAGHTSLSRGVDGGHPRRPTLAEVSGRGASEVTPGAEAPAGGPADGKGDSVKLREVVVRRRIAEILHRKAGT